MPDGIWVIVTVGYVVLAVIFLITLVWSRMKTGTLRRTLGKGQALLVVGAAVLFLVSVTALILIATGSLPAMSVVYPCVAALLHNPVVQSPSPVESGSPRLRVSVVPMSATPSRPPTPAPPAASSPTVQRETSYDSALGRQSEKEPRDVVDGIVSRCPDIGDARTAFICVSRVPGKLQTAAVAGEETKFGTNSDPLVLLAKILSAVAGEQALMSLSSRVSKCADTYGVYLALRQQGQSPESAMDALRETTDMERISDALEASGR